MLLGYLFGVPSERKLVKEIEVNVAYRWFLKMGLTEKVIDASTLSQNRIRRFNDTDVFVSKGLVGGHALYTDSTHLKANANKNKSKNQFKPVSPSAYIDDVNEAVERDRIAQGKKPFKEKNYTQIKRNKVSTTDSDSGYMHRDEKPKGFFYLDHRTVDGKNNIIVDSHVTPGNVNDSQPYIQRIDHISNTFNINPIVAGIDAGYFSAPICHALEERNIAGVFGYRRPSRTKNKFKKKPFDYDAKIDQYTCPAGKKLIYKTTSRDGYREYHSNAKECAECPLLRDCTQSQNHKKVITRHVMEVSKERANERRLTDWGKKVYKRRCATVERSFADAKQHHGHRYARFRSLIKVQMQCLLAATAQKMKKMALVEAY